jgi:hypothetical protein
MATVLSFESRRAGWILYPRRADSHILRLKDVKVSYIKIKDLFEQLQRERFPAMGKRVGDFVLYDSLLSGMAASLLEGRKVEPCEVPNPDRESAAEANRLLRMTERSGEQTEFLRYFQLLDRLRLAMLELVAEAGQGKGPLRGEVGVRPGITNPS